MMWVAVARAAAGLVRGGFADGPADRSPSRAGRMPATPRRRGAGAGGNAGALHGSGGAAGDGGPGGCRWCKSLFPKGSLARMPAPSRWERDSTIPYAEGVTHQSPGSRGRTLGRDPPSLRTPTGFPEVGRYGEPRWGAGEFRKTGHPGSLAVPRVRYATLGFDVMAPTDWHIAR